MNTIIFRTLLPGLTTLMLVFSVFVLLRGHNEPGGGFIGGLIAASSIALFGISAGVVEVRRAMIVDPLSVAGFGVLLALFSGLLSIVYDVPFLTSIWASIQLGETQIVLSTPLFFDIGVYCVVLGTLSAVALALEENEEGE
jgi:multicomponent Na+:H+ antiporter subunit B